MLAHPFGVDGHEAARVHRVTKRLGLMHQLLPKAKRLAVLLNPANANTADATVKALGDAALSDTWRQFLSKCPLSEKADISEVRRRCPLLARSRHKTAWENALLRSLDRYLVVMGWKADIIGSL